MMPARARDPISPEAPKLQSSVTDHRNHGEAAAVPASVSAPHPAPAHPGDPLPKESPTGRTEATGIGKRSQCAILQRW